MPSSIDLEMCLHKIIIFKVVMGHATNVVTIEWKCGSRQNCWILDINLPCMGNIFSTDMPKISSQNRGINRSGKVLRSDQVEQSRVKKPLLEGPKSEMSWAVTRQGFAHAVNGLSPAGQFINEKGHYSLPKRNILEDIYSSHNLNLITWNSSISLLLVSSNS